MKVKKIIYIDNDHKKRALEDLDIVKDRLEAFAGIKNEVLDSIQVIHGFSQENQQDMFKLIFSGSVAIATFSMYTHGHYNSASQFLRFMFTAATSEVKNIVYIDGSGQLIEFLQATLRNDYKFAMAILQAIETNYIITFDNDEMFRIRVDLKGMYNDIFKKEKVDLVKLLSDDAAH